MKKLIFILVLSGMNLNAQTSASDPSHKTLSLKECIDFAILNNENIKTANLNIDYQKEFKKGATEIPKTALAFTQGQFNSIYKFDNCFQVTQQIPFPGVFIMHNKLAKSYIKGSQLKLTAARMDLVQQIKTTYYSLLYYYAIEHLLEKEDSIYQSFATQAKAKYDEGKGSLLENITANTRVLEIKNQLLGNEEDINAQQIQLQTLLNSKFEVDVINEDLTKNPLIIQADSSTLSSHPYLLSLMRQIDATRKFKKLEMYRIFPDFVFSYVNLSIYGPANIGQGDYFNTTKNRLSSFLVGMNIPLYFYPQSARIKAAEINTKVAQSDYNYNLTLFEGQFKQSYTLYQKYQNSIIYYRKSALANSQLIINQALKSYNANEISYVDYLTVVSQALDIETNFLNVINQNNLTVLKLEYLLSKQEER